MSFSDLVRSYWRRAKREGRPALVSKIEELQAACDAADVDGLVSGTGTDGNSVTLMRSSPQELQRRLLAAEEALVYFDDGRTPGVGRTVMVQRWNNRSVS